VQLDWEYATKTQPPSPSLRNSALPTVTLSSRGASLGSVCREIATQASISIVFPQSFDTEKYTGDLSGSADALLDAIARRSELRFTLQNGVGLIGKPLPEDRSIAVFRLWLPDPEKTIQPLLTDGGKITISGGWVFVSDRSENVFRLMSAIQGIQTRAYAVQVLEVYTDETFNAGATLSNSRSDYLWSNDLGFSAQLQASAENEGSYIGSSWTGIVSEGQKFQFFQGSSENRNQTIVTKDSQVLTNVNVVQTGWHFSIDVSDGTSLGEISADATDQPQYTVPFSTPGPGLYLVNSSRMEVDSRTLGFPTSQLSRGTYIRHIWLRYKPLGTLLNLPPGVKSALEDVGDPEPVSGVVPRLGVKPAPLPH
jgi:hypothetical protein